MGRESNSGGCRRGSGRDGEEGDGEGGEGLERWFWVCV